jgi:hypothetical protein
MLTNFSDASDNNARGHLETSTNENGHAMLYVILFYLAAAEDKNLQSAILK